MPFFAALGASAFVAAAAWAGGALTSGGAVAAGVIGTAVLSGAGWSGALVLGVFFLPSTLIGRLAGGHRSAGDTKGERRDAVQVFANGWAAALGALLEPIAPGLGLWIVTGSLAAAAADTWATSVGALSRSNPRNLITFQPVPPGSSGGVTVVGCLGAATGALSVALAGSMAGGGGALLGAGTAIGFVGMLLDSWLGAGLQGRFECPECGTVSERPSHHCGAKTHPVGGWRWLDNDGVNAVTTGFAAIAAGLVWVWRS